jgi:heme/copper-type cytochrome/quinol oxidase subunit 2
MSEAPQTPPPEQPPPGGPDEPDGSRNLWTFLAVGAGVIVLAVVLFLVLRPDDDGEEAANTTPTAQTTTTVETTTEATTESTTTVETTTEETTTTPPADQPQRIVIEVENAQPVGGVQTYDVDEGKEVVLVIRSDVADEVHLHGYDLTTDVAPGQTGRIRFRATDVGEFEIELEDRAVPIGELVVS